MNSHLWKSFGVAAVIAIVGCGGPPQSNYGSVKLVSAGGTVKLDGTPLPNAVVTFETDDGQFSYGMTDSAGNYKLRFDSAKDGVIPGKKIVRISTTRKIPGLNEVGPAREPEEMSDEAIRTETSAASDERVPPRYNQQSELTVEVSPDRTQFDFDLASS